MAIRDLNWKRLDSYYQRIVGRKGAEFYKDVKGLIFGSVETENDCIANMDRVI